MSESLVCVVRWTGHPMLMSSVREVWQVGVGGAGLALRSGAPAGVIGLGWDRRSKALLALYVVDPATPVASHTDARPLTLEGAPVGVAVLVDGRTHPTACKGRFCEDEAFRVHASADGRAISMPRFATDLQATYEVVDRANGEPLSAVEDDHRYRSLARGLDLGDESAYTSLCPPGPPAERGLYRMQLRSPGQPTKVATLDWPGAVTVSESLGLAVVACYDASTGSALWLVDLRTGATARLCEGEDPDIWPR